MLWSVNKQTYARFHQRRLTLIPVQVTLHLFLVLRIRKRWIVSWTEIKVNLRWWNRALLYQISVIHNCESELLKSARLESILAECDVWVMKIHNTVWYQLKTTNSWLYTAPRNETLHILCKDNKLRQTQLFFTGLIRLSAECDAISEMRYCVVKP